MAGRNFNTGGPKAAAGANGMNVSEREDLSNFISLITRDESPFYASIGKTKSKGILHEWQTDELASPGANAVAEGSSFATVDGAQVAEPLRTRLGNYTQINSKTVEVSGSKRAVDQAGVADEYAYQLKKRGTELRRDVEHDLVHSWNPSNGSGTRTMGGYQSFTNVNVVVAGAAAGYVAPSATGAGTVGTIVRGGSDANLAALELSDVDDIMQSIYQEGGKATTMMCSPSNKRKFSAKAQAADSNVQRNIDDSGKLRQSVEMYDSDFGAIRIVPNYIMGLDHNTDGTGAASNSKDYSCLVYDPQWYNVATLRPLHETEVGQAGDSTIGQIVEECTLEVRNPKGCGLIVGLAG
tara:strand:+ start:6502 stop:7557 length:1056 start_codon:yes stop_codon:yes gene_type:complete